jgi:hypothetical protein
MSSSTWISNDFNYKRLDVSHCTALLSEVKSPHMLNNGTLSCLLIGKNLIKTSSPDITGDEEGG